MCVRRDVQYKEVQNFPMILCDTLQLQELKWFLGWLVKNMYFTTLRFLLDLF